MTNLNHYEATVTFTFYGNAEKRLRFMELVDTVTDSFQETLDASDTPLELRSIESNLTYASAPSTPCPNHEGAFDCNPFCPLCEGDQEL